MINTILIGADRACSPERAFRTADVFSAWITFAVEGHAMTGAVPAQYQGTTVSGASLPGTGVDDLAFGAGVTTRVRKGVPTGTTTSSSPPV